MNAAEALVNLEHTLTTLVPATDENFKYQNGHCGEFAFALAAAIEGSQLNRLFTSKVQVVYRYPSPDDEADEDSAVKVLSHVITEITDRSGVTAPTEFDYTGRDAFQRWIDGFQELHPNSDWEVQYVDSIQDFRALMLEFPTTCFDSVEVRKLSDRMISVL